MALTKVPSNLDAAISVTQSAGDNSTKVATTSYVDTAISALSDSAPAALNTLNEIAAALGDDANYASTTTAAIAAKLPLAGGTLTGNITINKEDPNINLSDSSSSRTLAIFVDNNNSVVRASGPLLLQVGSQSAITIDASRNTTASGNITAPKFIMTGGSQIGQDYAYLKSNSTSTASLTLRKDSTGADSIDFLQLRSDGNGLIGKIEGDGDISFKNAIFSGTINSGAITSPSFVSTAGGTFTTAAGNDLNIVYPASRSLFIKEGSETHLTIDNTGNVGIGTAAPAYKLALESTATGLTHNLRLNKGSNGGDYAEIAFQLWNGSGTGLNTFGGSGTSRPSVVLRAVNEATNSAAGAFVVGTFTGGSSNSTLTEKFRVASSGNVGIGDTNPAELLTVTNGNIKLKSNSDGNKGILKLYDAAGTQSGQVYPSAGDLRIWSPNDVLLLPTGNVGIGTTNPSGKLQIQTTSQSDTGVTQLELTTTVNANPSHINQKFSSGAGWIAMIQAEQRAAGQYGALNFWTANNGNPAQKMALNYDGDLSVGDTGVQDSPHPLHKKVEVTAAAATSNAWSTNAGSNGGYDVSSNDTAFHQNRGSISAAGYYNNHVAHFSLRGNFAANTWYPFTTRTQLQTWIPGAGGSQDTGMPMYFRVYTYDVSGGGGDYLSHRLTDRFWFTSYSSNSTQRHQIPLGPGMGHAPNRGNTTDHQDYGNNPIQVSLNHRLGSDSYYPASQTFDIWFNQARTGLTGGGALQVDIYAYIG